MSQTTSPKIIDPSDGLAATDTPAQCTVYYDGSCPLCQREINLYQSLDGNEDIHWHDVSAVDLRACDLSGETAMGRFHMRRADGTLVSGARGFAEVMKTLPRLRWLGHLLAVPPFVWLAEGAYRLFLPIRPVLKKWIPAANVKPRNDAGD